jgi:ATP-binding cassette subfamily C (CFTR/MRP) protein 1
VLFDAELNERFYWKCIEACALKTDLDLLKDGDKSMIGERGINLSGGQKARLGLARAVYQRADLYLLDDVFSAVDANVAKHIFDRVIGPKGLLKETTRFVSMNSTRFLSQCDLIVVIKGG